MIHTIKKYLQLIGLIFKHGRLRHSGENFNQIRTEGLKELQEFIPVKWLARTPALSKNAVIRNLVAQLSLFKNSLKLKGGHVTVANLSYIRIAKSASTSMTKEMLESIYPALKQKTITEKQINFLADVNLQTEIEQSALVFTIVRNPLSRLVSVYRDFFENKNNFIYRDYLCGILDQHISFAEFVNRIMAIPDRLKDPHIRPQHTFLEYYEKKMINIKIFKLEEPEKLNQFLKEYTMKLPHLNKSERGYDYRSYYDVDTLEKVSEIYKVDIERFGYQATEVELRNHIKTVH